MTNLEKKLFDINSRIKKERFTISLREINDLFLEAKEAGKNAKEEEITEKAKTEMMRIFLKVVGVGGDFFGKWEKGGVSPTDEELDLLKKNALEFEKFTDKEYQSMIDKKEILGLREEIKEI